MRTRVVGSEPSKSEQAGQRLSPAGTDEVVGTRVGGHALTPQELSSGISEYCRQFQALADASSHMMWRFGPDGLCKYFNQPWLTYRGRTAEQECGAGWTEGVHPEDLLRCTTSYRSAFETRQPFYLEFRVRRPDASYSWVLAHGVPQYLLDGSFVGYVGSIEETRRDDSGSVPNAHKSMEAGESARQAICQVAASLNQSVEPGLTRGRAKRQKQRTVLPGKALLECLDLSLTPMVVVNKRGRYVYYNHAFQKIAAEGLPTARNGLSLKITERPNAARPLNSAVGSSAPAADCAPHVQAWLDSNTLREDLRVSAQPLTIAGDNLTLYSIIDTTHENRARLLERAFLHDLVNAAGSIQMLIDLLTGGSSRQERAEYIKLLQVSINRLLGAICHEKMMLDSTESMPSGFQVHEILTSLADYYRKQSFARNCRIEVDIGDVESMQLLSDQTLLIRVLDNMLRNAIEASSQGGVVTLGCRHVNRELEFWIHNPNTISENVRTKIIRPSIAINERERDAETPETKLLSELCGGTVEVSSHPEFGTTYSVRYPVASEAVSPRKRYRTKHAS